MTTPDPAYGTAEHAALITKGRHPGVQTALAWLADSHLPANLQTLSRPFYSAAVGLLIRVPNDSAELTTALNTLVEAKDWMVRAGIRSDQGVPGPVPRPATVVDPPVLQAPPAYVSFASGSAPATPEGLQQALQAIRDADVQAARPIQDRPQA